MIQRELDDEYFAIVEAHLQELNFRNGVMISVDLGQGNEGTNYILRKPQSTKWWKEFFNRENKSYSVYIADRDDAGARALGELKDSRGGSGRQCARAIGGSYLDNFFKMLQMELAFYIGCINLHKQLEANGMFRLLSPRPLRQMNENTLSTIYMIFAWP